MIDIFNYWFVDEYACDIAIVDYMTWSTTALEHKPDEEKGSDDSENIWNE